MLTQTQPSAIQRSLGANDREQAATIMSRLTKAGGGAASGTSSANYRSNSANYRSQSHDAIVSPALAGGLATVDACRECVGVLVQYALEPESAGTASPR